MPKNNHNKNHQGGQGKRNDYRGNGNYGNRSADQKNVFTKEIKSPYNFVPLNKQVYIPQWWDKVSLDIPFEDGIDGSIEVIWENISPLFIRDASVEEGKYSMHIMENGNRRYFIPGASLKGMLRNVISIISFGKMEQYDNQYFGHREFDRNISEGKEYASKMANVKFGWLEKQAGEKYVLYPCKGSYKKYDMDYVKEDFGEQYKPTANVWDVNYNLRDNEELFPYFYFDDEEKEYRLFCTGWMKNKKHELLIPVETFDGITLDDKIVESFLTVYAPTPGFEKFVDYLNKGNRIPVSYICDKDKKNTITAIGMGRMFRYPYKHDITTLVSKEQIKPAEGYDLSETMFGRIANDDKQNSLKGRVQIGNAMMQGTVPDNDLGGDVNGVLAGPKASYYPLYLKQDTNGVYRTYEDAIGIAGRKRYRIHQGSSVVNLPQGNGNDNVQTKPFYPIPRNNTFKMRINLHNLKAVELGALLLAIKLKEGAFHNIGTAKAYGYGKLICSNIALHLKGKNVYDENHYISLFKEEMESFTDNNWSNSDVIKSLVSIMSEHTNGEMFVNENGKYRVMSLDEYKHFKKNNNFSKLKEEDKGGL